ncbi:8360_t:CDS:2 [Paraglomus occultum]|uniref:8360_t:CDS:1 n=1 Tax=Paraglomus occultum TaxID=144539 RepID=A0A9N9FQL2_9GLOM|nr:8360_t:CDS:2 [Paraglomus occultum]
MSYSSHLCSTCDVLRVQLRLKEDQLKAKEDQLKAKDDKICQLQEAVIQIQKDLIAAKEETLLIKGLHELTLNSQSRPVSSSTSRSFMTGSFIDSGRTPTSDTSSEIEWVTSEDVIREHRAYVGNVGADISKSKLKRILEHQIGSVRSIDVVVDKHCAFAEFATREIYNMAVSIGFVVVDGRKLKIEPTKPPRIFCDDSPKPNAIIPRGPFISIITTSAVSAHTSFTIIITAAKTAESTIDAIFYVAIVTTTVVSTKGTITTVVTTIYVATFP